MFGTLASIRCSVCCEERILCRSWFLALPIVVVIAHGSSPWVRKIATESIYVITICLGYVLVPALLAPSKVRGCCQSDTIEHSALP